MTAEGVCDLDLELDVVMDRGGGRVWGRAGVRGRWGQVTHAGVTPTTPASGLQSSTWPSKTGTIQRSTQVTCRRTEMPFWS